MYYVSPTGNDAGSGSLSDPWATLNQAIKAGGEITVLKGRYRAPTVQAVKPVTLTAAEPVLIEPSTTHGAWTPALAPGQNVWQAPLTGPGPVRQAVWASTPDGKWPHRIPVWNPAAPFDTPEKWAAVVTGPGNTHTRWGLYSTSTSLYLIPPVDGSFGDPNGVTIWAGTQPGLEINGPDVQLLGPFTILAGAPGIRLDASAQRAVVDGVTLFGGTVGVAIYAGGYGPNWIYGADHHFSHLHIGDDGMWQAPGETPVPGQKISWNVIKHVPLDFGLKDQTGNPILISQALTSAETCGFWTSGGASNMLVEDSTIDGTFDGASHYAANDRYDARCDTGLTFRRVTFRNNADDGTDRSRHQNGVLFEDCTFENCGTVCSPAPLWGTVTYRKCQAWRIGDQVRVTDGAGHKPPGSVIKCGGIDPGMPQGKVYFDRCICWTDTPTTQGVSQDGGVGSRGPALYLTNNVFRVGYIAVNWPYGPAYFQDQGNVWSTTSTRPLKTNLPITLTPPAQVDARYYDPRNGDFSDMSKVQELQAELDAANQLVSTLQAQVATTVQKQAVIDQLAAAGAGAMAAWQALQQQATRST